MNVVAGDEEREPVDPGSFTALVSELASIADAIDTDPASLRPERRKQITVILAEALGRVDAAFTDAILAMERHGDAALDGARSIQAWVTARTELSSGHVTSYRKIAHQLQDLPIIADAWRIGVLGTAKIRLLLKIETALRPFLIRDQNALVTALAPKTVRATNRHLARWRQGVLAELDRSPDDPAPHPEPPTNSFDLKPGLEGETILSGIFDTLTAAELNALTDAEIDRLHRQGLIDRTDGKTLAQRRADALLALTRRGAESPDTSTDTRRIVINIHIDLAWLLDIPARTTEELLDWPCETTNGDHIPLQQILPTLDDATLNLILGHLDRRAHRFRPIGEITTKRLADPTQRRLLRARDHTCRYPGCDTPATWAKAHHEPPWEQTHHTTVPQLVLLCPHHHRLRHHANHRIHLEPNGDITIRTPDGTLLTEPPADHKIPRPDRPPRFTYRRPIPHSPRLPHWNLWRYTNAA